VVPEAPSAAPPQPSAFQHPRLAELMKKAQGVPGIGQVLIQTVMDLVHPGDKVLACYHQFDATAPKPGDASSSFYTCEVVLVTGQYFIGINLFPKSHTFKKRKIHTVTEVQVRYDPPALEDIKTVQAGKFVPGNLTMHVTFADDKGAPVETWSTESTHPEAIRNLFDIQRVLSKCVGWPLAQIPASAVNPPSTGA